MATYTQGLEFSPSLYSEADPPLQPCFNFHFSASNFTPLPLNTGLDSSLANHKLMGDTARTPMFAIGHSCGFNVYCGGGTSPVCPRCQVSEIAVVSPPNEHFDAALSVFLPRRSFGRAAERMFPSYCDPSCILGTMQLSKLGMRCRTGPITRKELCSQQ